MAESGNCLDSCHLLKNALLFERVKSEKTLTRGSIVPTLISLLTPLLFYVINVVLVLNVCFKNSLK